MDSKAYQLAQAQTEEILRYFHKCNVPLRVWQNSKNGNRIVKDMNISQINGQNNTISMELRRNGLNSLRAFSEKEILYAHSEYRNFLCSLTPMSASSTELRALLPESSIIDQSPGGTKRIKFITDGNRIKFYKQLKPFNCPLLDISDSGLAFTVTSAQARRFSYEDDELVIKTIVNKHYEENLRANVVYISKTEEAERFRVGIKFQRYINSRTVL